jgi:conserved oligomeric Golgi complex subunit 8
VAQANIISQERALNKTALQQHQQLLKLLEVPQWMDTCVRGGFYEESLQLQSFVNKLETKYPDQPIVQAIVCRPMMHGAMHRHEESCVVDLTSRWRHRTGW